MWRRSYAIIARKYYSKLVNRPNLCGETSPSARIFECTSPRPRSVRYSMSNNEGGESSDPDKTADTPPGFLQITEGRAKILFPESNEVFYNPVQEVNRDLSTLVVNHFTKKVWEPDRKRRRRKEVARLLGAVYGEEKRKEVEEAEEEPQSSSDTGDDNRRSDVIETRTKPYENIPEGASQKQEVTVLEALAASGLRSIRYALEVPAVSQVLANDLSEEAYQNICRNIAHNGVEGKVIPSCREASILMYEHRDPLKQFTVIDLDPYGSPSTFLDSAVQAVCEGGLLCVTSTDASVLCGNNPETCHAKYGSVSLRLRCCHEMGVRIILSSLESHANRYRRYIVPLLSCSIDFYMRVFVQVFTSASQVKRSLSKKSMVYGCTGCDSYYLQPLGRRNERGASKKYPPATGPPVDQSCEHCGEKFNLGGPIWSEPTFDQEFVRGLLEEFDAHKTDYDMASRIRGLLSVVSEELHDVPLHYVLDRVCGVIHCVMPNMLELRSAIMEQGYRVSITHTNANAIKTDAPNSVLWDIMRCWVKKHPVKGVKPGTPGAKILSKEPEVVANFSVRRDANPPSRRQKMPRFPDNPEAHWGPKARAKRKATGDGQQQDSESAKHCKTQDENIE